MNPVYRLLPIAGQNLACTAAGWNRRRQRFTPRFRRLLDLWGRTWHSNDEELRAIQALRLAELLDYARESVPRHAGLPPIVRNRDPRRALEETLAAIPPQRKEDYRDAPLDFLSRKRPPIGWTKANTSGTTGTALRLFYSPGALAEEYAVVWRMRHRHGVTPADPHLTFGGRMIVPLSHDAPPFWRRDTALNQTLFSLYHVSARNLPAYIDAVHATEATYVQGYPSSLHLIGRALLDAGRPLPKGRLKAVFTSSETVLANQRAVIEEAFGTRLFDRYGASELAVSMTSCDVGHLHVDMEYCIVEVEPHERGEGWVRGPLLVTGFANRATPFIRYRIGDIGTRLEAPCPCGRPGDVFESVDGRIEDYVVTPSGRMIGRLDHVFKNLVDIAEAQIVQDELERIVVRVVAKVSYSDATERALLHALRIRLGADMQIAIERVAEIPREANGKLRAVKSSIGGLRSPR